LSMDFYAAYTVALALAFAFGYWAIGTFLFWKRSDDRLVLYASVALVAFGATQPDTLRWLTVAYPVLDLPVALVDLVGDVSFFVLFCVFPDGRFVPRWTLWTAVAWAVWLLPYSFRPALPFGQGSLATLIDVALAMIGVGLVGSLVVAQVYRYRRASTQEQRQQTKWVVFGFATSIAAFVGVLMIGWILGLTPIGIPQVLYDLVINAIITLAALLIPLSIAIAILRQHLWHIDLIINRALVYGTLSAVLAAVFAITDALVLPIVVKLVLGKENDTLNVGVSAVTIAVLVEPLRRRIQKGVDKLSDRLSGGAGTSETPR
jgi:hypothetical protein